jgi:transglutaminase-like putative cysteine protease
MKIKNLPLVQSLLFVALVFLAGPAFADATTNLFSGETWALLNDKQVLAAAADINLAKYPDCDEATVDKKMVRVYHADGTGLCQDEAFVKVLTEKGKRNNRTLELDFTLPYSTQEVAKIEVIKPDGTVVPVDIAANSKETIDDSQMSMNIYDPNSKILQVNIPQVEIGDIVHAVTRQTITRSYMPGEFAEESVFEDSGYIRHLTYEIHAPLDRPLKQIAVRDEVPGTIHYETHPGADNTLVHVWEVKNVPRMFAEPSMPPAGQVLQRVLISTTPDWQAVSKWYWDLSRPHLEATIPEMKTTVDKLTAGAKTDLDKVKAIFYHVSKNIRYMGLTPEKDRPGFEPHDVKITFAKQYGVCRDKAALLVSLLRTAGLKAYPVLISVGVKRDPQVADPFFNHAIVAVELKEGEYTLMDPTDEHTRDLLPSTDCNQSYLVCREEGEKLRTSPVQSPEEHMMRIKTTGVLAASGALEAKSELYFQGINDDAYRNAFSHMKPDDRRRFFERNLKQAMPGARLNSFKLLPEDMLDTSSVLRAELEFSVNGMTATGSGKSVVSVPWIGKSFGIVNFILGGAGLEKRKYPMQTTVTCGLQEDVSVKLADGFGNAVSMPSCSPVDDDCLDYGENFRLQDGTLDCSREFKLKVVEFNPAQYLKLKQALKSMQYDERKVPVLATSFTASAEPEEKIIHATEPTVESNAKILESHKELVVTGPHSSVYRVKYSKEILNYAGKIREAEIKVSYNPACEQARLVHAVVVSKTGQRQEISTNEINVMDEGWNASAKRYTGGKILVANLPSVEVGSKIEVEFEITSTNKPFLAGFESFQLRDAMEKKSFQLTVPGDVAVQKLVNGPAGSIHEEDKTPEGSQRFEWTADHVSAQAAEAQTPPEWMYGSGVSYFIGDMKAYLKKLNDTMIDRASQDTKAAATARELTAHAKTKLEAIEAIRNFAAKSIRLAGPSFTELPLSELSAADTTLADGYGHGADRAILLDAMLSAAGFHPEFVMASELPPIAGITNVTYSFPLPNFFQAPLVRVTVDGENYYLNDSDQYAKLGATAYDGQEGLVLSTQSLELIKAAKGCDDRMETDYSLSISGSGKTRLGVTRHYYGQYYDFKNRYFSELPPEERRRYYQELVSDVAQGARPEGDLVTHFETYPGMEQFTVDVDNYCVVDGKYLYFDLPFTPSLLTVGADRRALPLYIARQSENTVRAEIELPEGFRHVVIAPKSEDLVAPDGGGKARIISNQTPDKWIITYQFETDPAIIAPDDYGAVLKLESALERKSSKVFLFSSAEP